MDKIKHLLLVLVASIGLGSFAAAGETDNVDPYENINRATNSFNEVLDDYVARPVAKLYTNTMPDPLEKGVVNLFRNLGEITNVINDLLQGKYGQAANDSGRFLINTTVGVGGLFDVAQRAGLL